MLRKDIMVRLLYLSKKLKDDYELEILKCAKECNITKSEADILLFFGSNKDFNKACDAVNYRGFSKSYVSKAIDRLIKKDFINIEVDQSDRRYQRIIINDKANNILTKLQDIQRQTFELLSKNITKEEFQNFFNVIEKFIKNIEER